MQGIDSESKQVLIPYSMINKAPKNTFPNMFVLMDIIIISSFFKYNIIEQQLYVNYIMYLSCFSALPSYSNHALSQRVRLCCLRLTAVDGSPWILSCSVLHYMKIELLSIINLAKIGMIPCLVGTYRLEFNTSKKESFLVRTDS